MAATIGYRLLKTCSVLLALIYISYADNFDSCRGKVDGVYKIVGNCTAYYRCVQGDTCVEFCPPGTAFSELGSRCLPSVRVPERIIECRAPHRQSATPTTATSEVLALSAFSLIDSRTSTKPKKTTVADATALSTRQSTVQTTSADREICNPCLLLGAVVIGLFIGITGSVLIFCVFTDRRSHDKSQKEDYGGPAHSITTSLVYTMSTSGGAVSRDLQYKHHGQSRRAIHQPVYFELNTDKSNFSV